MKKLSHEDSVELMLLFICSQVAARNVLDNNISDTHKDEILDQIEKIAAVIHLPNIEGLKVH